tara:strand:- start:589 stop:912 length:324 start_codon:yes stop_codon:yes gene_type:complete
MVCRTKKKRDYADKIFTTNTYSAIAHVTRPVEIPIKMKKENSIIDDSSEWYNTFRDVRYCLDKEYETVCKRYDIDQDNRIYNKIEKISREIADAIHYQETTANTKQY